MANRNVENLLGNSWEDLVGRGRVEKIKQKYLGLDYDQLEQKRKELEKEEDTTENLLEIYVIKERIGMKRYLESVSYLFEGE